MMSMGNDIQMSVFFKYGIQMIAGNFLDRQSIPARVRQSLLLEMTWLAQINYSDGISACIGADYATIRCTKNLMGCRQKRLSALVAAGDPAKLRVGVTVNIQQFRVIQTRM
ncbi:MAG: hypothetical protein C0438_05820 [Pseudomonas sp.]|nr:hypothetical protein [Pseudomonas sp.]